MKRKISCLMLILVFMGARKAEAVGGVEVYKNFRQGIYACYSSLTIKYRGIYNSHDFLRGGQYNVYWSYYEPQKGVFDWNKAGALKAELDSAKETKLKTYLQIDAYGWDAEGALPRWLDNEIDMIDISGKDDKKLRIFWNRVPMPWDSKYHQRLRIFLTGLRDKIRQENAVGYISGIEMGTGPMAQTSFSWSSIQNELIRQSGVSDVNQFCQKYNDGVKQVIDIYADIFEDDDIPLVLIGGSCYGTGIFENFKKYAFSKYGLRLQYKMAGFGGWGNDTSCGRRPEFKTICSLSCPGPYLKAGDSCPSAWCGQESGTNYDKWGCKDYAGLFKVSIAEDNLTTTCLYSNDYKSANGANHSLIRDFAGKLGAKVSYTGVSVPGSVAAGGGGSVSIIWKNEGSTSLVWPQRVDNGDGTERERSTSYQIFLVFVDRNNRTDSGKWYSQYVTPDPGTNSSSWKQKGNIVTAFDLDVPGLRASNYDVYIGLGPSLSSEDMAIGRKGFGFGLWNSGNWGEADGIEGNNMYLVKENVVVTGNDSRARLAIPFGGQLPVTSVTPAATIQPTVTINPTATEVLGDANGDGQVDRADFFIWVNEMVEYRWGGGGGGRRADFNNDNRVTVQDFVIWRREAMK